MQFVAYHTLMAHRIAGSGPALALVLATLALAWGCAAAPRRGQIPIGDIESGPGSLTATRKALEGTWTLDSLEVIDAAGVRRPVKSGGQLTYDDFGNMTIRGVIEDPALKGSLVLDYTGRITIDNVKHEFYPADLQSDRPVDESRDRADLSRQDPALRADRQDVRGHLHRQGGQAHGRHPVAAVAAQFTFGGVALIVTVVHAG